MQKPTEGTARGSEVARRQCVDHLRALLSIRMAHDYMNVLLGNFENCQPLVASGLHAASVIAYGRPFTPTKTKIGKVAYNIAALKRVEGFDRQLHAHLLEIRNRLIAHADYEVLLSPDHRRREIAREGRTQCKDGLWDLEQGAWGTVSEPFSSLPVFDREDLRSRI